jgi:histidine triad (HIT) family protein
VKEGCIFCKLTHGVIDCTPRFKNKHAILIDDKNPIAPFHALVMPIQHWGDIGDLLPDEREKILPAIFDLIDDFVFCENINNDGYRVVSNIGPNAGQTVKHLHFHVLAGALLKNDFGA